eukprot:scaffold7369_cov61-Phaeocystis_antarctica.AAC.3
MPSSERATTPTYACGTVKEESWRRRRDEGDGSERGGGGSEAMAAAARRWRTVPSCVSTTRPEGSRRCSCSTSTG